MKIKILISIILLLFSYGIKANSNNYNMVFDEVLHILETNYFKNIHETHKYDSLTTHYRLLINNCKNDNEFIYHINSMLFGFGNSHIGFGKVADIKEEVSPYIWYDFSLGIDVRIIEDQVIVTRIDDSFPISKSKLSIGDRIIEINSKSIDTIITNLYLRPPHNKRNYKFLKTEEVLRELYGNEKSTITLKCLDKKNIEKPITADLKRRKNGQILFEGFPEVFLDNNSKIYYDSIGYISFNAFQPNEPDTIINLIDKYKSISALIIDLRGNNGGSIDAIRSILSKLLKNTNAYYNIKSRNISTRFEVFAEESYKGNLIILVDELSISAAEIFSDLLQFTNSAKIVGAQTPGNVLSGELFTLSNNYNFLIPVADWIRSDGNRLEGTGVIPGHIVNLNKNDLSVGIDTQLEYAIKLIK